MRILLAEDDLALGTAVQGHLALAGHAVDLVGGLEEAEAALAGVAYGLLLLDIGLPDGCGLRLLRRLRARRLWLPVILLTARDQIGDRIAGLKAGADDYLVKPFDLEELAARIEAVARRSRPTPEVEFAHGAVRLNPTDHRASLDGIPVAMTGREWAVLDCLLRRPGAYVSRESIEEALYAFGAEVDSNAVEVRISRIRRKLGASLIETLRGVGYRVSL